MPIHFVKKKNIARGQDRSVLQNGWPDPIWVFARGIHVACLLGGLFLIERLRFSESAIKIFNIFGSEF